MSKTLLGASLKHRVYVAYMYDCMHGQYAVPL